jgi:ribosomal protein S10
METMVQNGIDVRIKARDEDQFDQFVSIVTPLFEEKVIIETSERKMGSRLIEVIDCDPDLLEVYLRFHEPALAYIRESPTDPRRLVVELILALNEPAQVPG